MGGEEKSKSAEELVTWLCWRHAIQGRVNYPPLLRAAQCMGSVSEQYDSTEGRIRALQHERGVHWEKYMDAVEFFEDMEKMGYDPKHRAEYEHHELQEQAEGELPELTWEWYDDPTHDVTEWPPVR